MSIASAGTLLLIRKTLVVQMSETPTDQGVRELREQVGRWLREREVNGLAIDLGAVDVLDSYLTRCVRDLAVGARLMGVETVVCGLRPSVADTVVDMGMTMDTVRAALDIDRALTLLARSNVQRGSR